MKPLDSLLKLYGQYNLKEEMWRAETSPHLDPVAQVRETTPQKISAAHESKATSLIFARTVILFHLSAVICYVHAVEWYSLCKKRESSFVAWNVITGLQRGCVLLRLNWLSFSNIQYSVTNSVFRSRNLYK
jgi:hypothetical protein